MERLSNTLTFITGGAGFLGKEFCRAILEEDGDVVLFDNNQEALNECNEIFNKDEHVVSLCNVDVTNEEELSETFEEFKDFSNTYQNYNLICSAAEDAKVASDGTMSNSGKLEDYTLQSFFDQMRVTLGGVFAANKEFIKFVVRHKYKDCAIVNVASELSVLSPDQRIYNSGVVKPVTYQVAKHGVVGLTKYLATYPDVINNLIRVNSLSPSGVWNNQPNDFVDRLSTKIPLGRMMNKTELRPAIRFLLDPSNTYTHGVNLVVSGGKDVW